MTRPVPGRLLQGTTLRLTALTTADVPIITQWYQNDEFLRLLDAEVAAPRTEAALTAWLEEQHKAHSSFLFGIRTLEDDRLQGFVQLEGILWQHQQGWITLAIGEPGNWGRGYGFEAMSLLLRFAFDELNLHRVQLTVFEYNRRAMALYEKLGFQREGAFREHLHRDGHRYDMYLYGLLRREWAAGHASAE